MTLLGISAVAACVGDQPATDSSDAGDAAANTGDGGGDASIASDAGTDAPTGPCNLAAPFGAPALVEGIPITNSIVRFSADEKTAYFAVDQDSGNGNPQLLQAFRPDLTSAFGAATPLDTLNDDAGESTPAVSQDGLAIIYTRSFATAPAREIWYATRSNLDAGFGNPTMIAGAVNQPSVQDDYPSLQEGNDDLWFVSTRDAGGFHQIFHAKSAGGISYSTVEKAGGVNADGVDQYYPVVTDDGLVIYYTRASIIYTASRASTSVDFENPTRVAEVADAFPGARPTWISPDRCRLYITTGTPQTAYVFAKPPN